MTRFGLVTEGTTDQIILKNILIGFFDDLDIYITELQPAMDETDKSRAITFGNWDQVLKYCSTKIFREAFQSVEFVIVQIDTDVAVEYDVRDTDEEGNQLSVADLILSVKAALITRMGQEFYNIVASRVLFAISVQSIECWLLPLFYTDNRKSKTVNCLGTLNQALKPKKFSIDPRDKKTEYYEVISVEYAKHKKLMQLHTSNPSLEAFVHELERVARTTNGDEPVNAEIT